MLLDGEGSTAWAMVQLVVVNPVVFVVGVVRSWFRYGWKWVVVLCAFAAAFLISVFTVYNASALGYLVGYVALSVVVVAVVMAVRVLTSHRTLDQD